MVLDRITGDLVVVKFRRSALDRDHVRPLMICNALVVGSCFSCSSVPVHFTASVLMFVKVYNKYTSILNSISNIMLVACLVCTQHIEEYIKIWFS